MARDDVSDKMARKAAARFFLGIAQAQSPWRDENTRPLFPLLMVMDEEMMDADAKFERAKNGKDTFHGR